MTLGSPQLGWTAGLQPFDFHREVASGGLEGARSARGPQRAPRRW